MTESRTCGDCGPGGGRCELATSDGVSAFDCALTYATGMKIRCPDHEECPPHAAAREQCERAEKAETELGHWRATLESLSANEEPTPAMLTRVLSDLRFRLQRAEAKIAESIYVENHGERR